MKVLIVGSARNSGGGVSSVIRLMTKMPIWEKYSCYWLGTQIQRNYVWKLWYALKAWLIALIIIWRFDIIHFHTVPDRPGLIFQLPIFLLAKVRGKKIVLHIHMGNQLKDHVHNNLFNWYLNKSNKIILLSECFKELMITEYRQPADKMVAIYNACESMDFIPFEDKGNVILMAGYFDENKAPDILMHAIRKLKDDARWIDGWKAILMGNGNVAKYMRICSDLDLDDIIDFPGYVTGLTKDNIWRTASIFCLCSHVEGFPMVILEAWNYGIPVLTTPVGGLPDVLCDEKNCCIFGFDDIDGLAEQLFKLMNNLSLRKKMSCYEQAFVKEHFSLDEVSSMYDNLYKALA